MLKATINGNEATYSFNAKNLRRGTSYYYAAHSVSLGYTQVYFLGNTLTVEVHSGELITSKPAECT